MRNVFGWSLPPGCSLGDIERSCGDDQCEVCCKSVDGCVCPPCPTCRTIGKAECYRALEGKLDDHGLELSMDQRISRAEYGVAQAEERLADSKMELEWLKAKKLNPELEG
jgi:hypothetical protein